MTEKVVLTKEQAEAIEKWSDKEQLIIAKIVGLLEHGIDEPIYTLTTKELIQAIYIGYEVEPEFKEGDYVVWHGLVVKIHHPQTNDYKDDGSCYFTLVRSDGSTYGNITRDEFRHATPEEITEYEEQRWWKKHGREVWELREGDILYNLQTYEFHEVRHVDGRFISLRNVDRVVYNPKINYKVVCFAEKRLDVN